MWNPRPKIGDGILFFGGICLMGATVVFPHISDTAGHILFWGGLIGMILYAVVRWGAWPIRKIGPGDSAGKSLDNRSGNFVGRDNSGSLTIHNAPVIIHNGPPGPAKDERPFVPTGITPERLLSFYDDHTALQVHILIEPYIGLWMRVSGIVRGVTPANHSLIQVAFNEAYGKHSGCVYCYFDKGAVGDLRLLKIGDKIAVVGELSRLDIISLALAHCEIVDGP